MGVGMRWGFDEYGRQPRLDRRPWAPGAMEAFGFDLWVHHYVPKASIQANRDEIREIDAWCGQRGLTWLLNVEDANWKAGFVDERGRDWYNHGDGRHHFRFPDELLETLGACQHLEGLLYDEAAHMQGCANRMAEGIDQPWVYDPEARGDTLAGAADAFAVAAGELAALHAAYGIRLYTEHVFPVMYHGFARAGWVAATKVLKENWSPAYLACAMGAALQYGTPLWVTPDLWGMSGYPGHSVDEYRSALLLAYHLGGIASIRGFTYDHAGDAQGSWCMTRRPYDVEWRGEEMVARAMCGQLPRGNVARPASGGIIRSEGWIVGPGALVAAGSVIRASGLALEQPDRELAAGVASAIAGRGPGRLAELARRHQSRDGASALLPVGRRGGV